MTEKTKIGDVYFKVEDSELFATAVGWLDPDHTDELGRDHGVSFYLYNNKEYSNSSFFEIITYEHDKITRLLHIGLGNIIAYKKIPDLLKEYLPIYREMETCGISNLHCACPEVENRQGVFGVYTGYLPLDWVGEKDLGSFSVRFDPAQRKSTINKGVWLEVKELHFEEIDKIEIGTVDGAVPLSNLFETLKGFKHDFAPNYNESLMAIDSPEQDELPRASGGRKL